jgi:DNA-binding FadR family transcriptional regulator
VEIAGLAARQCMEQEVEELSEIVDRMEAAMSEPLEYAKEDARFHRRLAQMAHNPLLVLLLDSISDLLREIRLTVSKYPQISTRGMPDHRKIMEQVRAHQVEEARLAMQQHLAHARQIQDEVIKAGEKN